MLSSCRLPVDGPPVTDLQTTFVVALLQIINLSFFMYINVKVETTHLRYLHVPHIG